MPFWAPNAHFFPDAKTPLPCLSLFSCGLDEENRRRISNGNVEHIIRRRDRNMSNDAAAETGRTCPAVEAVVPTGV